MRWETADGYLIKKPMFSMDYIKADIDLPEPCTWIDPFGEKPAG